MRININAVITERLFIVGILLLGSLIIADFIYVSGILKERSIAADHAKISAEVSADDLDTVKEGAAFIDGIPDTVQRSKEIAAQSELYQYQNQIITDIESYAGKANIAVASYSFPTDIPATGGAAAAPAAGAAAKSTTPVPQGLKTSTVIVTFGETVEYVKFLTFLKLIESNVTRMQVTDVSLTPDAKNSSLLTSPTITLMVYTR